MIGVFIRESTGRFRDRNTKSQLAKGPEEDGADWSDAAIEQELTQAADVGRETWRRFSLRSLEETRC